MALKVTLVKSSAGASERQLATLQGLGLYKMGSSRILKDTPENRGMAFRVKHLLERETVEEEAPKRERAKPRKIRARDAARARHAEASKS